MFNLLNSIELASQIVNRSGMKPGQFVNAGTKAREFVQNLTPTGKKLQAARLSKALEDPLMQKIYNAKKNLDVLGISALDAKSLAATQKDQYDALMKAMEYQRSQRPLNRMADSTFGRMFVPLAAMSAVGVAGAGVNRAVNVLGAAGVNIDPSARLAASFGLPRVIEEDPSLESIPRDQLRRHYEILFDTSPEIAKNPHAAATMLKRMSQFAGVDAAQMKELAETQKALKEPSRRTTDLFNLGNNILATSARSY